MNAHTPLEITRTETVIQALSALVADAPLEVRLRGVSMQPLLSSDDTVIVSSARHYWPGDVVLFRNTQDQLVTHRLLGCLPTRAGWRRWRWILRGDACANADGVVRREHLCGRVIGVRRGATAETSPLRTSWAQRGGALLGLMRYGFSRL